MRPKSAEIRQSGRPSEGRGPADASGRSPPRGSSSWSRCSATGAPASRRQIDPSAALNGVLAELLPNLVHDALYFGCAIVDSGKEVDGIGERAVD
jgi:hypothetical protein